MPRPGDDAVRHEVLQDVWLLVRDEAGLRRYVQEAVRKFLD